MFVGWNTEGAHAHDAHDAHDAEISTNSLMGRLGEKWGGTFGPLWAAAIRGDAAQRTTSNAVLLKFSWRRSIQLQFDTKKNEDGTRMEGESNFIAMNSHARNDIRLDHRIAMWTATLSETAARIYGSIHDLNKSRHIA